MNSAKTTKKKISEYKIEDIREFFSETLKKISSKIILLEIGNDFLNIGVAKSKKNKLYIKKIFSQKLPKEALDKSIPSDPLNFGSFLNQIINENKINTNKIALSLPSDTCYTRLIDIPEEVKEDQSINFVENPNDLIELYCGVGTFTLPLSKVFKHVFATENNRNAYKCLLKAIQKNNINNIYPARLSSNEVTELECGRKFNRMNGIPFNSFNFSHILVDPPRSGLTEDVINIISKYKNIIYISCNSKSYLRDIKLLSSHEIKKIELFDQFPNTEHLEIISLLQKK